MQRNNLSIALSTIVATAALLPAAAFSDTYTVSTVADLKHRLETAQYNDVIKIDGNGGNNGVYRYTSSKYNIWTLDGNTNVSTNYLIHDVDNVTIEALDAANKPVLEGTSINNGYVFYGQSVNGLTLKNIEFEKGYKGVIVDRSNNVTMDNIKVSEIGQEGIHMRDGSDYFVLRYSTISETGLDRADRGEAVYLCNDRKMWNPEYQPSPVEEDKLQNCDYAHIYNNTIGPNIGNNSVDIKEGTVGAYIENNTFLLAWTRPELLNFSAAEHPDTAVHFKGTEGVATGNTFNFANAPNAMYRAVSVDMQLDDDPTLALIHGFDNWAVNNTITNAGSGVYAFRANSDGGATYGCNTGAPDYAPKSSGTDRRYQSVTGGDCTPPSAPSSGASSSASSASSTSSSSSSSATGSATGYSARVALPGRIEAENYYQAPVENTAGNVNDSAVSACTYYGLSVDVQNASEGTCNVGWTQAGEQLTYRVGSAGGNYNIAVRHASLQNGRRIRVAVNGSTAGTVSTNGNGWQSWTTSTIGNVSIPTNATITVTFLDGSTNFNYLNISFASGSSSSSSSSSSGSSTGSCQSVAFGATKEVDLSDGHCINFSQSLTGEVLQVKDSDVEGCDFRGHVTDGAATANINANYVKVSNMNGTQVTFNPSNSCDFVLIKTY